MKALGIAALTASLVLMFSSSSPAESPTLSSSSGIEGTISISPIHGGPARVGVQNYRPLGATEFVVQDEKANEVASFRTDDQGNFRVLLAPGHYKILRKGDHKIGFFGPFKADVTPGQLTKVQWQCDSGMR